MWCRLYIMYTHSLYIRFLMLFFCVFKKGFNLIYSSISIAIHYFCKSSLKYSYFGSFFKSSVSKKKNHPFLSLTVGVILKIWQILLKVDWSRDIWFFFFVALSLVERVRSTSGRGFVSSVCFLRNIDSVIWQKEG